MRASMLILTLLTGPSLLASCADQANSGCAGWQKIQMDAATVDFLAANDPRTLAGIVAHMEFGRGQGCWE